ncbi:MAG: formyltransferase family protein [Chloroflexota bacterium]|nr:formyltransferase family protein [Chloroflexota bacterium]
MEELYKLGWFSSGRGEGSRNLFYTAWNAMTKGIIKAEFSFVFCNRAPGEHKGSDEFMKLVKRHNIPLICVSSNSYREKYPDDWRPRFEEEVMQKIDGYEFDLGVLAGYMLIIGEEMCKRYSIINLHPAKPGGPKGTWQEVIWELMDSRAKESGAMMHLVTPALDEGPPASYCTFSIRGKAFDKYWKELKVLTTHQIQKQEGENNPLFMQIRRHGAERELPLIIATIKAFSEGKVRIEGDEIVNSRGKPIKGYNLTKEVDKKVKGILSE